MYILLYIILFIFFLFYYNNFNDDKDIENKYIPNKNIKINSSENIINKINTNKIGNYPEFRGIINYHKNNNNHELGGSDPYKNNNIILIDAINNVDFGKYNSYRKKPHFVK